MYIYIHIYIYRERDLDIYIQIRNGDGHVPLLLERPHGEHIYRHIETHE